jgi:hypothetical protein
MYRNIDVMTEMRKLTNSKPVHAVAGAGVLASQTLKDLPGRLARWGTENPVTSLPSRATGYAQTAQARANGYVQTAQTRANGYVQTAQTRANGYVATARAKAADGYDTLAARGQKALNGQPDAAQAKSTTAAQGKTALNGKAKGKTTSRSTAGH